MDELKKIFLLNKTMSQDPSIQISNLETILEIIQTIQFVRYKKKDQYTVSRLHDSNLLYQKAYLHGLSILKLAKGIQVSLPRFKIDSVLNDPVSIAIIVRGLLETYLTFYQISFADNDDHRDMSYISWIIFGLKQRLKLKFEKPDKSLLQTNKQLYEKYNALYNSNMQRLEEEKDTTNRNIESLKRMKTFVAFDADNQANYIKQLRREWKFEYFDSKYKPLGYQDILNKVGLRVSSFSNLYNHLSWPTHSTSIGISQIEGMWNQDRMDLGFLGNAILYTNLFLTLMSRDVIFNDPDFKVGYKKLSREHKDLLNFYNYQFRGNEYTIDKID